MKIFKKLSRKTPEERIKEELITMEFNQTAIFFPDIFPKINPDIIIRVVNQLSDTGTINGSFIGNKGWFLLDVETRCEEIWEKLLRGPIYLDEVSKYWGGLGKKRVYMVLQSYAAKKKLSKPVFTRKENILYLNSFILQEWNDAVNKFDLDEGDVTFDKIISKISQNIRNVVIEVAKASMVENKTELLLGNDNIIRRRNGILNEMSTFINDMFEENWDSAISYELIAEKLGLSEDEVSSYILKLIDNKDTENITNYPIDGFINTR